MMYATLRKETESSQECVLRINDNGTHTVIVCTEESSDYQAYLRWLDEGNQPLPADAPVQNP